MRRHASTMLVLVALASLLAACQKPIALQPAFWDAKGARIGVAIVKYPEAVAHKEGAQGLLDMAINEALAKDLKGYLQKAEIRSFGSVADRFVQRLQERGFSAKRIDGQLDLEQFQKFDARSSGGNHHDKDLRHLAANEGLDFLVLLSVARFGSVRPYYGFIPLGPPKALVAVKGQLVNLSTNELLWQQAMEDKDATVRVDGDWDQPPDFPNLAKALQKAEEQAGPYLERQFFSPGTK